MINIILKKTSLIVANDKSHLDTVSNFRKNYGNVIERMEEQFYEKEVARDNLGTVFIYLHDQNMIATVRYVPLGHNASVIESLFTNTLNEGEFSLPTREGSRFVVHPSFRGNRIFKEALAMSMEWLRDNTTCQNIIAPIRSRLLPLYEKYGFYSIASAKLPIQGKSVPYKIILSKLTTILDQTVANGYQKKVPLYNIN
ncbi:GNAT family N-acetyltransferase [Agarilytica rhodophyticola]|uniref:GNAT family N-acetyltransferase n=1 Tax=Agarilytica rhodophyticola TaxID=1737490 RepID=UPI000CD9AD88|nr:GNAT family N-acetyltransferase [Agarilytica rhodophyticola]